MLKKGRELAGDKSCFTPSTSPDEQHVAQVRDSMLSDDHFTMRDLIEHVSVSIGSCQLIIKHHFGLQRVASRVITKIFTCSYCSCYL